jgi:hypothetical protein
MGLTLIQPTGYITMATSTTSIEDGRKARLERAKSAPAKLSKAEQKAASIEKAMAGTKAPEAGKPAQEIGKTVTPEIGKTDESPVSKAKKKLSATVVAWRALPKDFPKGDAKIKLLVTDKNPKRRDAASRFTHYTDGMTVDQYIEASVKAGHTKGGAREDVRWDFCKKFINIV